MTYTQGADQAPVDSTSVEALKAENAALTTKLAELERARERAFDLTCRAVMTSGSAVIQWKPDGVVTRWSDGAQSIFGWSPGEAVGKHLWSLVAAHGGAPDFLRAGARAVLEGQVPSLRGMFVGESPEPLDVYWVHTVIRDPQDNPTEVVSCVENMTNSERTSQRLHEQIGLLIALLDNAEYFIFAKDLQGRYTMVNQKIARDWGKPRIACLGLTDDDFFPADAVAQVRLQDAQIVESRNALCWEQPIPIAGDVLYQMISKFPVYDVHGELCAVGGMSVDITESKRLEAEKAALREQVILAQRTALRELSSPIMPIADGVLAMPIIGTIDSTRATQIMDALLHGVSAQRARTVILDITGVRVVDTGVADALVRAARAARLLGAAVVLTGIGPDVAQTLVRLEVHLGDVVTLGTLQAGIAYALKR